VPRELQECIPSDTSGVREGRLEATRRGTKLLETIAGPLSNGEGASVKMTQGLLTMLAHVEETVNHIDLRAYSLEGVTMTPQAHQRFDDLFRLPVPGLAEKRPSVLRGDVVRVFDYATNRFFRGVVHFVALDDVTVSMHRSFRPGEHRVNVEFMMSRTQERIKHRAVEQAFSTLFLTEERVLGMSRVPDATGILPLDARLTDEQRRFVNAFAKQDGSRGHLLWGPPGTGKTTTVVAAAGAVLARYPASRLLLVTPSNDAADVLVERLAEYDRNKCGGSFLREKSTPSERRMLRLNATQRDVKTVREAVLRWSMPDGYGGFATPSAADVAGVRVVVATLMMANRLYSLGIAPGFTHVLVDEAGHCTEAELLAGLQAAPDALRVLLAGDHRQLGPVIRSSACVAYGMGVSPLERLMGCCGATAGAMLTHNYRSTEAIVDIVNAVYDDKLEACGGRPGNVLRAGIPLVTDESGAVPEALVRATGGLSALFVHHSWPEHREADSPSWCNPREAHVVVSTALTLMRSHGLRASDIVVLSPYQKQVQKIRQILHHRFQSEYPTQMEVNARGKLDAPIKVSTVEMFQGREARAVLVSTVRNARGAEHIGSDIRHGIGFLKQPQRANVALSRAQDVMIVFGNADLLRADATWVKYIERFERQGPGAVMDVSVRPSRRWVASDAVRSTMETCLNEMEQLAIGAGERAFEREA